MRRSLISFAIGFVTASSVFALLLYLVLPGFIQRAYQTGHDQGGVEAQLNLVRQLPGVLGCDFHRSEHYEPFLVVKDVTIVVVERSGVKTLRVYGPYD